MQKPHLSRLLCILLLLPIFVVATPSTVVNSEPEFTASLHQQNPLDALTPYGKREFIRSLKWGDGGLAGLNFKVLMRELDAGQIRAVFQYLGVEEYLPESLPTTAPLRFDEPTAELEQRWLALQLKQNELSERQRAASDTSTELNSDTMARLYQQFSQPLRSVSLVQLTAADLLLYFDAATSTASTLANNSAYNDMLAIHQELKRRQIDTRRHFNQSMLYVLKQFREYDAARALIAEDSALAGTSLPVIEDKLPANYSGRTVLVAKSGSWQRQAFPEKPENQLIMLVSGGCSHSERALQAIMGDAELLHQLKQQNLQLLTGPTDASPFTFVQQWQNQHPDTPIFVPYERLRWLDLAHWPVPQFLFYRDGKLIHKLSGWPKDEGKALLLQALSDNTADSN